MTNHKDITLHFYFIYERVQLRQLSLALALLFYSLFLTGWLTRGSRQNCLSDHLTSIITYSLLNVVLFQDLVVLQYTTIRALGFVQVSASDPYSATTPSGTLGFSSMWITKILNNKITSPTSCLDNKSLNICNMFNTTMY